MKPSASTLDSNSPFTVALLVISLALATVLAWQAHDAARSHRAVAEDVLRDYARLAADEFIRRTAADVGYYGYYKLFGVLADQRSTTSAPRLPSFELLTRDADEATRRALSLARYLFVLDPASGEIEVSPSPQVVDNTPTAPVTEWLRREIRTPPGNPNGFRPAFFVHHATIGSSRRTFAFIHDPATLPDTGRLLGFETDPEALAPWFEHALGKDSLLPASLIKEEYDPGSLYLTVTDASDTTVFSSGRDPSSSSDLYRSVLAAEAAFGEVYEGIFAGLRVRVALDPDAASRLVIGGLPRSRLPVLIGLLVLTASLLVAAILQFRRTRDLARLRADFVSRVSHELRTPLTQIRMFAETLLLGRIRSDEEQHRSLAIIDQEARRLSHLVENILQFSRSERQSTQLTLTTRPLVPLIQALVRDFEPLADKTVRFVLHPTEDAVVKVDDDAMRQIVLNLLDNAVKYGPPNQQVRIGCEKSSEGTVRVEIEDEGPGIPQRHRQRIWQSFHRLDRDRRSAVAGTGIGLGVVNELVTLQGGRVWVESGNSNGARFVVELHLEGRPAQPKASSVPEEVPV